MCIILSHITPMYNVHKPRCVPPTPPPPTIYANTPGPSSSKLLTCLLCLSIRQHLRSAEADGNTAVRESEKRSAPLLRLISRAGGWGWGGGNFALSPTRFSLFTRLRSNLIRPNDPLMQGETKKPGEINRFH